MSTAMVSRPDDDPARPGDHVRDELHEYVVDKVSDHLADLGAYVLTVHDEDGTKFTLLGSEVVRCARHRDMTLDEAGAALAAAGFTAGVSAARPDLLTGTLDHAGTRLMVILDGRVLGARIVAQFDPDPHGVRAVNRFETTSCRRPFTVAQAVARAVALAAALTAVTS